MRIIVCGGRTFGAISHQTADGGTMPPEIVKIKMAERRFQYDKMDELHRQYGFTFLVEGGAQPMKELVG